MTERRAPSVDEAEVLRRLLSPPIEGAPELRRQLDGLTVSNWASPAGSMSLDLWVSPSAPPATVTGSPLPVEGDVVDAAGTYCGLILVWVDDGLLSALEYAWMSDDMPTEFPGPDRVRVFHRIEPPRWWRL